MSLRLGTTRGDHGDVLRPTHHTFDPCDFAGYLTDPAPDRYTKKTCLWTGGGFIMPKPKRVEPIQVCEQGSRVQTIKYTVASSPSLFPKPELVGKTMAITVDNQPIENLTATSIFVGSADQDLSDIPIHIRFAPVDGKVPHLIQSRIKLAPERY